MERASTASRELRVDRRGFLMAAGLLGIHPFLASRDLRVLVLGGTGFVGPHLVRAALARGHEVTLFNRGTTNPHLFPDVERLHGNRYPDRGAGLSALQGRRTWDAVIDTWQAEPGCVDLTARLLAPRAHRYVYVSSIATYGRFVDVGMTEEAPAIEAAEHMTSFDAELGYAVRKRASEQAVERAFDHRATVLRATSIQGPADAPDPPGTPTGYWPYRFLIGEPLLAPDDPGASFQLIDVRDFAEFAVRTIEHDHEGTYNLVGPAERLSFPDYLRACHEATGARSPMVWMAPAWLLEQGVRPWVDVPNWIPADDPEPGFYRISGARARAAGLTFRPVQETVRDGLGAAVDRGRLTPPTEGLSRARELELVEAWRSGAGG